MTKRALGSACILALVSLAALQGSALASDDAQGGGSRELLYIAINLVILLVVLVYFARKPIQEFFAGRREQIQGDLDSAAELLSQAEQRNSEIQRRLIDLQSQIEEIHETTLRRAEEESERILAEAGKTAERIQADAASAVDQELLRAQRELRAEAADLALKMASEILREQVTGGDRERLLDEFITRVEPGSEASR
ncbi:MAG: F0F1 ATP synthase subunit B [Deltaproteobacteria bacterium]|nr:F0F1 ATP synthase subunit B [Deltaproteobacteria bacterium]MBW2695496.1 F0F1 ATP synthase subunit B [Deltaproteobacteria bacterium]